MTLLNNWLFMALLVPITWALSCILDICFVSNRVYRSPCDGPIVAGFFCVLPLFAIVSQVISWHELTLAIALFAGLAGISYFLHVYFYFKALFILNDATSAEIFNTLSVLFVPLFAFFPIRRKTTGCHLSSDSHSPCRRCCLSEVFFTQS